MPCFLVSYLPYSNNNPQIWAAFYTLQYAFRFSWSSQLWDVERRWESRLRQTKQFVQHHMSSKSLGPGLLSLRPAQTPGPFTLSLSNFTCVFASVRPSCRRTDFLLSANLISSSFKTQLKLYCIQKTFLTRASLRVFFLLNFSCCYGQ